MNYGIKEKKLPVKCPLLEDEKATWGDIPYCAMIYTDLLAITLGDYCYSENYVNCSIYMKAKKNQNNNLRILWCSHIKKKRTVAVLSVFPSISALRGCLRMGYVYSY